MWCGLGNQLGRGEGKLFGILVTALKGWGVFILRTCHIFNHCDFFILFSGNKTKNIFPQLSL